MSTLHRPLHPHPLRLQAGQKHPQPASFGSKTPAPKKSLHTRPVTVNKTVGSKARPFSIYVDENDLARHGSSSVEPQRLFKDVFGCPSSAGRPQLIQSSLKPLEDKTNTIKKRRQKGPAGREHPQSPTPAPELCKPAMAPRLSITSRSSNVHATPHSKKSVRLNAPLTSASSGDPLKRILFRTPVTAKRARRPPVALPSSDCEEDEAEASFACSEKLDSLPFALDGEDVPDVEYGPPSASVEAIELPDQVPDFSEFLGALNGPASTRLPYYDTFDGVIDINDYVARILLEDGCKADWVFEPRGDLRSYRGEFVLDELHLPEAPVRPKTKPSLHTGRPSTTIVYPINPATRSTSSTLRSRSKLSGSAVYSSAQSSLSSTASRPRTVNRVGGGLIRSTILKTDVFEQPIRSNDHNVSSTSLTSSKLRSLTMNSLEDLVKKQIESEKLKISRDLDEYLDVEKQETCFGSFDWTAAINDELDQFRLQV